jgi:hypothetical protein
MKHVVVQGELHGTDIRPVTLLSKFRELSIEEAGDRFGDRAKLVEVDCPACRGARRRPAFEKNGFQYVQCEDCRSLYVSPRPAAGALEAYRRESKALEFRAREFIQATGKARRFHILRSHALWLGRLYDEAGNSQARGYADLGTNYPMVFDEIAGLELFDALYCIEPLRGLEEACRQSGARIEATPAGGLGALSAFEQLEHQFSPGEMLARAHGLLATGGMLVFTTRTISGFDLQVLWEKVPYIYVPEHLNLLSVEGIGRLVEEAGFRLVELSTPGQLDVELTLQAMEEDATIVLPSFLEYLLRRRGRETLNDFQEFLQKNRLSSHVRVAAVKE